MKKKIYIAYGSNMNFPQMNYRCPDAELIGAGKIPDYELLFKGSKTGSYATIEPKEGSKVLVLVWRISANDEMRLDRYEGWPEFYYKNEEVPVEMADGATIKGMAYIMHEERLLGIPTQHYFDVLAEAYRYFGWDIEILRTGLRNSNPKAKKRGESHGRKERHSSTD